MHVAAVAVALLAFLVINPVLTKGHPGDPKNKKTITGEVIDSTCYASAGAKGDGHKECAQMCINNGLPIGILDKSGKVYVAVKGHMQAKSELYDFIAQNVTASGTVSERGGVRVIDIDKVEKAK
jgi:hypothetical protein